MAMFFAREAAHPRRLRFVPGFDGRPVRIVDDSELLEPNNGWWNSWKSQDENGSGSYRAPDLPIYAINWSNLLRMNKDTLNTLQYFTGLRNFSLKEQQAPKQLAGLVPVVASWKSELSSFVDQVFTDTATARGVKPQLTTRPEKEDHATQRKELYSRKTGRLIETKNARRFGTQRTTRYPPIGKSLTTDDLPSLTSASQEHEYVILQMLGQILQTDDPKAVGAWLASANDRERTLALELVRSVLHSRPQYFKHQHDQPSPPVPTASIDALSHPHPLPHPPPPRAAENGNGALFTIEEDAAEQPTKSVDILNVDEERRLLAGAGGKLYANANANGEGEATKLVLPPIARKNVAAVAPPTKNRLPTQASCRSRTSQHSCPHCGHSVDTWRPATSYAEAVSRDDVASQSQSQSAATIN